MSSPYVPRIVDGELDEISPSLSAIAIEGAKGVGKTATALERAATVYRLEDPDQRAILDADLSRLRAGPAPILIDEWQRVPGSWDVVRRAVDDGAPPGTYLLTGSPPAPGVAIHSGAGRIVSVRMRPLSLAERGLAAPTVSLTALLRGERVDPVGTTAMTLDDYVEEILRSGFPGLRSLGGRASRSQLDGYLERIVEREFAEAGYIVRNPAGLRRWLAGYAAATATNASFEAIRSAATGGLDQKPSRGAAAPYRDVLERLHVLDPLPPWLPTRNHIARLSAAPKHHLVDTALTARLLNVDHAALVGGARPEPRMPRDGTLLGALFESLVTQSVRVYAQAAEARVGHLRTHRGEREVDLIVEGTGGRVLAIEVRLAPTFADHEVRHLHWLKEQLGGDLVDAAVITTGQEAYRRKDGIAVIPAALLGP